jgi:hypothetical protein
MLEEIMLKPKTLKSIVACGVCSYSHGYTENIDTLQNQQANQPERRFVSFFVFKPKLPV